MPHQQILRRYQDKKGRITLLPHKPDRQQVVLDYLASKFEVGKIYTEKEVNGLLNENHSFNDPALLRRELVEKGLIDRTPDGKQYWRNIKSVRSE
jgi:hypothetical protein